MLLSEAIRLGALLHEQAFGMLVDHEGRTCAAGAALEAIGMLPVYDHRPLIITDLLMEPHFPIWSLTPRIRPGGPMPPGERLGSLVMWLNDVLRWPREAIADWVQEVELREEELIRQEKAESQVEACA